MITNTVKPLNLLSTCHSAVKKPILAAEPAQNSQHILRDFYIQHLRAWI
jgi:hypothetical protein